MKVGQLEAVLFWMEDRDGDIRFVVGCPDGNWTAMAGPTLALSTQGTKSVVFAAEEGIHASVPVRGGYWRQPTIRSRRSCRASGAVACFP